MDHKVFISEDDEYLFGQGTHYDIYEKLGAHPSEEKGKKGFFFAVWAPNAADVHVVGDFNGWDENAHQRLILMPILLSFVQAMLQGQQIFLALSGLTASGMTI